MAILVSAEREPIPKNMHTKTDTEKHLIPKTIQKDTIFRYWYRNTLHTKSNTEKHAYPNRYRKTCIPKPIPKDTVYWYRSTPHTKNDTDTDHFRLLVSIQVFFGTSKFYWLAALKIKLFFKGWVFVCFKKWIFLPKNYVF